MCDEKSSHAAELRKLAALPPNQQFRTACQILGWSANAMATRLGCGQSTVAKWCSDTATDEPPPEVVTWAADLAAHVLSSPPPQWKRR